MYFGLQAPLQFALGLLPLLAPGTGRFPCRRSVHVPVAWIPSFQPTVIFTLPCLSQN